MSRVGRVHADRSRTWVKCFECVWFCVSLALASLAYWISSALMGWLGSDRQQNFIDRGLAPGNISEAAFLFTLFGPLVYRYWRKCDRAMPSVAAQQDHQ